jgi:hypothetical protein
MLKPLPFWKITVLSLLILLLSEAWGQTSPDEKYRGTWNIRLYFQVGKVFNTNSFLGGENLNQKSVNRFHTISIQAGKQTYGNQKWQKIWAYPSYGFGFSFPDFYISDELGRPFSLYGYFIAPFKRWDRLSINYEISFGIALNWKPYHAESNPYNVAIGSYVSLFADWGLSLRYRLTKRFDLGAGITLSHFSNGAVAMPNQGINTIAPRVSARYNFRKQEPSFKHWDVEKYKDNWELQILLSGALKQLPIDTSTVEGRKSIVGVSYGIASLDALVVRQISYKVKMGGGINLVYNTSENANVEFEDGKPVKAPGDPAYYYSLSLVGSLELVFHRLSLIIQPGYQIARKKYELQPPAFFQRIGLKYHFTRSENLFMGVTVRAYEFHIAIYTEWSLGYRIRWNNK